VPYVSDMHLKLHYDWPFSLMVTAYGALAFCSLLDFASGPASQVRQCCAIIESFYCLSLPSSALYVLAQLRRQ